MGHGVIWADRIGHLALDTEVYLLETEIRVRPGGDSFVMRGPVCNQWLADKFAAHLVIDNEPREADIEWHAGVDPHYLIESTLPMLHVGFNLAEQLECRNALAELGVTGSHVIVHCRDAAYLDAALPGGPNGAGWSYHDYRDADIDTYLPAMHAIVEHGDTAIRVGAIAAKPLGHTGPGIIDYPYSGARSDILDCWLAASCRWMLATSSGPCALAALFRKPIAFANVAPFFTVADPLFPMGRVFIPKLYRSIHDGHILSVREIRAAGADSWWWTDSYQDHGVELVDNTPEEIAELVDEIEARLLDEAYGADDLQTAFWDAAGIAHHGRLRIGSRFLAKHAHELLA